VDEVLVEAFNDQIALEQASARAYRQLSIWAEAHDYAGAAEWLASQADEELEHADIFVRHVLDRGGDVALQALEAPAADFDDIVEVFRASLRHEQAVTDAIGRLYELAQEHRDIRSIPLLTRFLEEQVEEEASVRTIIAELEMVEDSRSATLLLDRELPGRRTQEAPAGP
jgi:ferritin